ncbi:putative membrane protein [Actinoplanes lutulentus]|uniref:Putative membrane protein n=1 Tax=Actinoplanes lutulentus TaxID=1287878 RepID=A0A327Z2X0_9ACTN|nr:DUF1345 domain-containing protein [Actinoplanes lutulentus]MBB2946462.1 putative membrane protein [Actinoplanes lutulentus]RAK24615.1 putative membrane protein [Actinoplanes lutulentus]
MAGKAALIASRFIEVALLVAGALVFVAPEPNRITLVWDILAIVYLAIRMSRLRRDGRGKATAWLAHGLGGRTGLIFTIFTSLVGLSAGVSVLFEEGADKTNAAFVAVPAVLFAWAILHFGYAERYAKTYYAGLPEQVLAFPNTDEPTFVEFSYFSFTLGTTFSVSDVETQTSPIRLQILSHSIISFLYNTVTIGIAVSVISG